VYDYIGNYVILIQFEIKCKGTVVILTLMVQRRAEFYALEILGVP
jgi:hypothetical protein